MEHFKDAIIGWKLDAIGHNPTAEQYLGNYSSPKKLSKINNFSPDRIFAFISFVFLLYYCEQKQAFIMNTL